MKEEILNLEYRTNVLILKALNKSSNQIEAASLLGISTRKLQMEKRRLNIVGRRKYGFKIESNG